jgi:hypothetical protein
LFCGYLAKIKNIVSKKFVHIPGRKPDTDENEQRPCTGSYPPVDSAHHRKGSAEELSVQGDNSSENQHDAYTELHKLGGKPTTKLHVEDKLLLTLQYHREYLLVKGTKIVAKDYYVRNARMDGKF